MIDRSCRGSCPRPLRRKRSFSSYPIILKLASADTRIQPVLCVHPAATPYLDSPRSPLLLGPVAAPLPPCNGGDLGGRFVLPFCHAVLPAADGRLDDNDRPLSHCIRWPVDGEYAQSRTGSREIAHKFEEYTRKVEKPRSTSWSWETNFGRSSCLIPKFFTYNVGEGCPVNLHTCMYAHLTRATDANNVWF